VRDAAAGARLGRREHPAARPQRFDQRPRGFEDRDVVVR